MVLAMVFIDTLGRKKSRSLALVRRRHLFHTGHAIRKTRRHHRLLSHRAILLHGCLHRPLRVLLGSLPDANPRHGRASNTFSRIARACLSRSSPSTPFVTARRIRFVPFRFHSRSFRLYRLSIRTRDERTTFRAPTKSPKKIRKRSGAREKERAAQN